MSGLPPASRHRVRVVVISVHVGLILLIVSWQAVQSWLRPKPDEIVMAVSLAPAAAPAEVVRPQPEPVAPEPPPPPPPPAPAPAVVSEPPPQPKREIERSTKRVRREPEPASQPALSAEQIRQQLARALPAGAPATTAVDPSEYARYAALIRETLYRAWAQPTTVPPGLTAEARIRVARDGRVTERRLTRASGVAAMDASIQQALAAVTRLAPLPASIKGAQHDFTIEFALTGALP
jgi:TonB family protein